MDWKCEDGVNQSYCDLLFYVDATPGSSIDDPERPSIPDEGDKEEPKPDEDENVTGTLAFEDIWPSGGDYDMNDVIVEYERKVYFDKKNIVTKIVDEFTPVHDGATYVNAFAYQIDAAQIGDKITLPEGAILEKETSSIIVMSNAKQILEGILKLEKMDSCKPLENRQQELKRIWLNKLVSVLEEHMENTEFNVAMLCQLLGMNRKLLYRKIKQLTGVTPVSLIRRVRMIRAATLLLQGRFTVSEVMYMVGYSNPSYFSRCFMAEYNISPSQYAIIQKKTGGASE